MESIKIRGARTHNLKNIDVDIALNRITCIKGPSGSGKSSLAFHTLYNESRRRYLNSMPGCLKFFSERPLQADVDEISPVLPIFALRQSNPIMTSRQCVMDVIGLLEKLQKLFYFLSNQYCPQHHLAYVDGMPAMQIGRAGKNRKWREGSIVHILIANEDYRVIYGTQTHPARSLAEDKGGDCGAKSSIRSFEQSDNKYELMRFRWGRLQALDRKHDEFLKLRNGQKIFLYHPEDSSLLTMNYSQEQLCPKCAKSPLKKRLEHYSPYNALGACPDCSGHGAILVHDEQKIFPNLNLSLSQGATRIFDYKRIKSFKKSFIQELIHHGYSDQVPLKKFSPKLWHAIRHGGEHFCGLEGILKHLERKRYKKDVRVLLRNLRQEKTCGTCVGARVIEEARYSKISYGKQQISFSDVLHGQLRDLAKTLVTMVEELEDIDSYVASLLKSMMNSLRTAVRVGLGDLPLLKKAKALTPGEYQRLLMVKYLSFEGEGSLFIFDEPSLGLSEREQKRLFREIIRLRNQGNTILIIEHAKIFHQLSDEIIEMGHGAGPEGGKIIYQGAVTPGMAAQAASGQAKDYSQPLEPLNFVKRRPTSWIIIKDLQYEHYQRPQVRVPLDCLTQVIGESGSGKTQVMIRAFPYIINNYIRELDHNPTATNLSWKSVCVEGEIRAVHLINANLGNVTRRSTVGSFLGISPEVRKYYASLKVSKMLGLRPGHFSPRSALGQCPSCGGKGFHLIDMAYLENLELPCEDCGGRGLQPRYAEISDQRYSAFEAFTLPMKEVMGHLKLTAKYLRVWQHLQLLNLDYLSLARPLNSLSGGERQRIGLLACLTKKIHHSLLIFEHLSFGLSERELGKLAIFLRQLCHHSNAIVVVDNHCLFNQVSDYVIDFNQP